MPDERERLARQCEDAGPCGLDATGIAVAQDVDAVDDRVAAQHRVPCQQTGLRAPGAAGMHHMAEAHFECLRLGMNFDARVHVSECTDGRRGAHRNFVGHTAVRTALRSRFRQGLSRIRAARDDPQPGAEQAVEQDVPVGEIEMVDLVDLVLDDQLAFEADGCCRRGRLAAVIGLQRPRGDEAGGALRHRIGDQVLELAHLVAAKRQAGAIVTLDPEAGATEQCRESRQWLQGCREMREAQFVGREGAHQR